MSEKKIFTDQAGYLPEMEKKAVVTVDAKRFEVINGAGDVVLGGDVVPFGYDEASGDTVGIADFSSLTAAGRYHLRLDSGEVSYSFEIGGDVYRSCFDDVTKAYYFLRCGCALEAKHAGEFTHAPCHTEKALLWEDRSIALDVTGGWHDAGDYGRYTTAAACALGHLLYAFKFYPEVFEKQDINIPESGGALPDILAECKVELDWLMKMQRQDGAVYHKATTAHHAAFVMPEEDTAQMFVLPPSSMATADIAAVCALASGIYREFDSSYADRLYEASLRSYGWLELNPDFLFRHCEGCDTGGYGERTDLDNRFWAAAELYALTGDEKYLSALTHLADKEMNLTALGYGDIAGLGALAYIMCTEESDPLRRRLVQGFTEHAERLAAVCDRCGYGASLPPDMRGYHWGSNMSLLKNGMIFLIADRFGGTDRFESYAAAQLHYLLGCNALGYSYVSGTGGHCINYPHLRPAFADGIERCIPGMVSGGPNGHPSDEDAKRLIPEGTPPMKCFADDYRCYSLNEITIYWNSPAVFLLAHFCREK